MTKENTGSVPRPKKNDPNNYALFPFELLVEFPEVFDHCVEQTLWNTTSEREMRCPVTPVEEMKRKEGVYSHENQSGCDLRDGIQENVWSHHPICSKG